MKKAQPRDQDVGASVGRGGRRRATDDNGDSKGAHNAAWRSTTLAQDSVPPPAPIKIQEDNANVVAATLKHFYN